jgi:hypothetical protein
VCERERERETGRDGERKGGVRERDTHSDTERHRERQRESSYSVLCTCFDLSAGLTTVVDTEVRKTWELDPSKFNITNPAWNTALVHLSPFLSLLSLPLSRLPLSFFPFLPSPPLILSFSPLPLSFSLLSLFFSVVSLFSCLLSWTSLVECAARESDGAAGLHRQEAAGTPVQASCLHRGLQVSEASRHREGGRHVSDKREADRETERQTETERKKERDREKERERDRDCTGRKLQAHLYKLLVCTEGCKFQKHRDTEKEDGM